MVKETDKKLRFASLQELSEYLSQAKDDVIVSVTIENEEVRDEGEL